MKEHPIIQMPKVMLLLLTFSCMSACQNKQSSTAEVEQKLPEVTDNSTNDKEKTTKKILFFGDSLTAGYQLDEAESFPSLIQDTLNALKLDYEVINAGLSGETSSGGLNRIDWVLNQPVDVFVLELGANDALRGLDANKTKENLEAIITKVKSKYPEAKLIIAGMLAPPNLGKAYEASFNGIFKELASKYNAGLVPFLLEGVAAIPELNLQDGLHPNAKGQLIVRDNVWKVLNEYL